MDHIDLSEPPSPVLVIVAHPDDIDFGSAGTVARLTSAGAVVTYALVTSGEAGPPEDEPDRRKVAAVRHAEQEAAAAAVGVHDVRWLGHPDGRVEADLALRRDLSRVIRQVHPQLVITQTPQRRLDHVYISHPDHLAVGAATLAACYPDAGNRQAHPELIDEGLQPHSVSEVWVMGAEPPDVFVDITGVFTAKIDALTSHVSQVGDRDVEPMMREWATELSTQHGLPAGTLTEAFRRVSIG